MSSLPFPSRFPLLLRRHLTALLVLITLWGAANWRLLTPVTADQWSINSGDFTDQMFTFSSYQAERLSAGQIPAWWPRNNGGQPFIADPQMATFYPVRLLFIAASGGHWTLGDLQAEAVIALLLAGLFTYGAAYAIARSFLGAFVAGLIMMASGLLTGYPIQQLPILESVIWLPLVILALQLAGTASRRCWRWLILAGAAIGISYLAGHVQTVLMITYLALAYWGFLVYRNKASVWLWIGGALLIGGVAIGVSAVQLFPGLEFMALSTRGDALTFADKAGGLTFGSVLQTIWPGIVSYFSPLYIGVATWAAIAVGVTMRDRVGRFWAGTAAVAGLLSFGGGTIVFTLAYWLLPGLSLFRDQERFALIAVFALAIVAAFGIKAIVTGQLSAELLRLLRIGSLVLVVLTGVIALGLSLWTFGGGAGNPIAHLDSALYAFLISTAGFVIVYQLRTVVLPLPKPAAESSPSPFATRPSFGANPANPPPTPPNAPGAPARPSGLFGSRPPTPPPLPGDRPPRLFGPFSNFPSDERPPSPFGNLPGKPPADRPDERANPLRSRPPGSADDRNIPPDDRPAPRFRPRSDIPPDDRDLPPDDRPSLPRPFGSSGSSSGAGSGSSSSSRSLGAGSSNPFGSSSAGSGNPFGSRPPSAPGDRPLGSFGSGSNAGFGSGSGGSFGARPPGTPPGSSGTSGSFGSGDSASSGGSSSDNPFGRRRVSRPASVPMLPPVRIAAGVALVVLIAFDLLTWANTNTPSFTASPVDQAIGQIDHAPAYLAPVLADQTDLGAWRVDGARALSPRASLYKLSDVFGASPLQLAATAALNKLPVDRYWELFAVRYVITDATTLPVASTPIGHGSDAHGAFTVQQLTDPRLYARLVYQYDVNSNAVFDRQLLADPKFPIRDKVILDREPSIKPGNRPTDSPSAVITVFAPEVITVTVNTSANALLTLALPYYPGWQATIDERGAPILKSDTALSAIAVPAGLHTVQLRFVPVTAIVGGAVSLTMLALLSLMLIRWYRETPAIRLGIR